MIFNIGDKVLCIDDSPAIGGNAFLPTGFQIGLSKIVYTVHCMDEFHLGLTPIREPFWRKDRFVPVNSLSKVEKIFYGI